MTRRRISGRTHGDRPRALAWCALAAASLTGACGAVGDDGATATETTTAALTAGSVPAAVALLDAAGAPFCSASLIGPRVALTAAHCVVRDGVTRWPLELFAGADLRVGGAVLRLLGGEVHPAYDSFLHTSDVAVLRLADGPPAVTPLGLASAAPAPAPPSS